MSIKVVFAYIFYQHFIHCREHGLANESDSTMAKKKPEPAKANPDSPEKSSSSLMEKLPDLSKFGTDEDDRDETLQRAIQASLQANLDEETKQIQEAIAMSLEQSWYFR